MATGEILGSFEEERPQIQHVEQNASMFQQLANAQVNARYIMAMRNPRDLEVCRQHMLKECKRPSFCAIDPDPKKNGSSLAIYSIPRGNVKNEQGQWVPNLITGPTIRTAEMMMRAWGHISVDVLPIGEDDKQRMFQVVCTDYSAPNTQSEVVIVPKSIEKKKVQDGDIVISSRQNSYGTTVYLCMATEEELAMRKNALVSKARRNLILQCIPGWLVEECMNQIRATARATDAEDPDRSKRVLFDAFAAIGVSAEALQGYLGHADALAPAELETLRGIYSGIREGAITWRDVVAAKDSDDDGNDALLAEIAQLLNDSGRTPAQQRNIRGKYTGKVKELVEFLRGEKSKAPQAIPAQAPAKVQPIKPEPEQKAEPKPEPVKAQPQPEPKPTPAPAATQEPLPPADSYNDW
jgi:hypothetical protein